MKTNMGIADRTIRILAAIALAVLYYAMVIGGASGLVFLAVAGVMTVTSIIGFCPLYSLFGISTRKSENTAAK